MFQLVVGLDLLWKCWRKVLFWEILYTLSRKGQPTKNENQFELKTKHVLKAIGPHFAIFQFAHVPKSYLLRFLRAALFSADEFLEHGNRKLTGSNWLFPWINSHFKELLVPVILIFPFLTFLEKLNKADLIVSIFVNAFLFVQLNRSRDIH